MRKQANIKKDRATARDIILISKIYQSFEALEETLGKLKLEEPLFITHVAKKSFNMITKKATRKNVIPAVSTYKLRTTEIYYKGIRVMPSYIMTGGNILIEKSKVAMATEDIATMIEIIK